MLLSAACLVYGNFKVVISKQNPNQAFTGLGNVFFIYFSLCIEFVFPRRTSNEIIVSLINASSMLFI